MYYWIILENIHTSPMDGYPVPGIQIVERGRKKKQGETRGGKGEGTPVHIPLQSSFCP